MSEMQSTLGENQGIAEELAEGQREISIAEFFEKNKHMLGFDSPGRGIVTAVKEGVDNSLDATEEAGFLPDISVEIEKSGGYYQLCVTDNGPGITEKQIPKVFGKLLYGSRFGVREQNRGQQGIGISAAVLYSQLTSGKAAKITSKTPNGNNAQYFELVIDTDDNTPEIKKKETVEWDVKHGTRIELEMEANMRARKQLHKYIKHTAIVNPHANVSLSEPKAELEFERSTEELPDETQEIQPHPHGVDLGPLMKMLSGTNSHSISGFLQEEFTRVGQKTAQNIINTFKDKHFGRELALPLPDDTDEFRENVSSSVRNKGEDATDGFVDEMLSRIGDGRVTHSQLKSIVSESAMEATDEFGKTFGSTVQRNAADAAWSSMLNNSKPFIVSIVDDATSSRKSQETIEALGEEIYNRLSESDSRQRYIREDIVRVVDDETDNDVFRIVNEASDRVAKSMDVTIGETARTHVIDELWDEHMKSVPDDIPKVKEIAGDRQMSKKLQGAMHETRVISPPTDCLSPIGSELIQSGLKRVYDDAAFYASSTRDAEVYEGDPFIAEAGIAYGGGIQSEGKAELLRFANRVPLVYQQGACSTTRHLKSMNWRNYNVKQTGGQGFPDEPMVILVHVASTNVPFTSESKDAIASAEPIVNEVEMAVREAARELKSYLSEKRKLQEKKQKREVLADVLPELANRAASVIGEESPDINNSLARIVDNVLIDVQSDNIRLRNYTNKEQSFGLHIHYDDKPDSDDAEETEDGWVLDYTIDIKSGETINESIPNGSTDVHIDGVPDEIITIR